MSARPAPVVRFLRPGPEHLRQVAGLRWDAEATAGCEPPVAREHFIEELLVWCAAHRSSHLCVVGVTEDDHVVAFGFVALTARAPSPGSVERRSADLQTVFVAAPLRNLGIGGRLVDQLVDLAREHGAEHVTVHTSREATSVYERAGFERDPLMLSQTL